MAAGHTPGEAEAWAKQTPSWNPTPTEYVDAFAAASARVWKEIAKADPQPWKTHLAAAAEPWMRYRLP